MKRSRDHKGESMIHYKRKARVDEEPLQKSRKKETSLSSSTSPRLSFPTRHSEFSWYEDDLWIEVAKFLDGKDLIRLAVTSRWFYHLIMEDNIWKYACLRDLQTLSPHCVSFKWSQIYASAFDGSHAYSFREKEKHIDWMRVGAFFFETPSAVLTEKLALPSKLMEHDEDHNRAIQLSGTCILKDIRTGIWIADLQLVRRPARHINNSRGWRGIMQILDMRHFELFLEESFINGSWQFEDIGSHRIEKQCKTASAVVFDYKHISSSCAAGLLDTSAWFADHGDWQPRARLSTHAVAVKTNLPFNCGRVRFQAMRSKGSDEKVVSIRISHQLF